MDSKNIESKIDDAAAKAKKLAAKARAKMGEAEAFAKKSEHKLEETAAEVGHAFEEVAGKIIHSTEEAAQKVIHGAQERLDAAERRVRHGAHKARPAEKKTDASSEPLSQPERKG